MILERAELIVREGREQAFAVMMKQDGCILLSAADGCRSVSLGRGIENPAKFILLLEWETVEHHLALTPTPSFAKFRELAAPYLSGPAEMEHFAML